MLKDRDISSILYATYNTAYQGVLKEYEDNISDLYDIVPSQGASETYSFLDDLVSMQEVGRTTARLVANYAQKEFSVPNTPFGVDFGISRIEYKRNAELKGVKRAENVAKSAKRLYAKLVLRQLNGAFTTSEIFDGNSLINATHAINDDTNINNLISGALTETTFITAVTRLEGFAISPIDGESEDIFPLSSNVINYF